MQNTDKLKVTYIAAGAAGMICGSCLRDNALVTALQKQGCDAVLVPTYTPLRLDEEDVSLNQIFFGGINVFLQQKSALFRRLPPFLGRALDHPALLKRVAAGSIQTEASLLGDLALSMLRGADGYQAKEVDRLVDYLKGTLQPDLVNLTNILIAGVVPTLKSRLGVPVVITLQEMMLFWTSWRIPIGEKSWTRSGRSFLWWMASWSSATTTAKKCHECSIFLRTGCFGFRWA